MVLRMACLTYVFVVQFEVKGLLLKFRESQDNIWIGKKFVLRLMDDFHVHILCLLCYAISVLGYYLFYERKYSQIPTTYANTDRSDNWLMKLMPT